MSGIIRYIGRQTGLDKVIARRKRRNAELRASFDGMRERVAELERQNAELERQNNAARLELASCLRRLDQLEDKSHAQERIVGLLERTQRDLSTNFDLASEVIDTARLEVERLGRQAEFDSEETRKIALGLMEQVARVHAGAARGAAPQSSTVKTPASTSGPVIKAGAT